MNILTLLPRREAKGLCYGAPLSNRTRMRGEFSVPSSAPSVKTTLVLSSSVSGTRTMGNRELYAQSSQSYLWFGLLRQAADTEGSHADHTAKMAIRQRMTDINTQIRAPVLAITTSTEEVKNSTCLVARFHTANTYNPHRRRRGRWLGTSRTRSLPVSRSASSSRTSPSRWQTHNAGHSKHDQVLRRCYFRASAA
jgi:hypothetical protein